MLLEEFQGVQAQHAGALVVGHAAADDPAVPHLHVEGIGGPAVALGHHVQVSDGGNLLIGLAGQLGPAHVALAVVGGQTHLGSHLQRLIQCGGRACAEGLARLRGALHAVDIHQALDIAHNIFFVGGHECIHRGPQFLCNHCFLSPYLRSAASRAAVR